RGSGAAQPHPGNEHHHDLECSNGPLSGIVVLVVALALVNVVCLEVRNRAPEIGQRKALVMVLLDGSDDLGRKLRGYAQDLQAIRQSDVREVREGPVLEVVQALAEVLLGYKPAPRTARLGAEQLGGMVGVLLADSEHPGEEGSGDLSRPFRPDRDIR